MEIKQFFEDLILENRGGKTSTKKVWGHIILILVSITYVLDGTGTYKINEHLFDAMLICGTTLIGASTLASIFTKRKTNETTNETTNE
jgi:undecaprenyl pyrophosphate phosphatase UppP